MFTSIDKAITAFIMGGLSIGNLLFGSKIGIDPNVLGTVIGGLTPILVWLIPNKSKA